MIRKGTLFILIVFLISFFSSTVFAFDIDSTIKSLNQQIEALDVQITKAKATMDKEQQAWVDAYKKHPDALVSGDIISYNPNFIIWGSAIGENCNIGFSYIQILNPDDKWQLLSSFSQRLFFSNWTKDKKGNPIAVFEASPKDLVNTKSSYDNAKSAYDRLIASKNSLLVKKQDALDQKAGLSVIYYQNGDKYVGKVKDNNYNGIGTFTWANGDKYTGEWLNSKKNGKGKIVFANGDYYEGDFKNDLYEGSGILRIGYVPANELDEAYYNSVYVGEFKSGLYNGKGELKYDFLTPNVYYRYTGEFTDGYKEGYGEVYYNDNTLKEKGIFKYGVCIGEKIDNTKSFYIDDAVGYSFQYPSEWGIPTSEKTDKYTFGKITTLIKNDKVNIYTYGNYVGGISYVDFIIYGMQNELGEGLNLYVNNADYAQKFNNIETGDGTQENKYVVIASREGQACHVVMKISADSSEEDIQRYNSVFDQIINSLVLIPVPVG